MTQQTICIIDLGSGNLRSVAKAVQSVAGANQKVIVSDQEQDIRSCHHLIMPGQGAFATCKQAMEPLRDALEGAIMREQKPFMGICVGMQLLADQGLEHGSHQGLGWIKGQVVGLNPQPEGCKTPLKIPHIGWNDLNIDRPHPVMQGLATGQHVYFVHSYHYVLDNAQHAVAHTNYGQKITAAIAKDNIFAGQFHPEKSQHNGLKIIQNFLQWCP